jgi:transcriptional regulator with XRE-family HTH domain
LRGASEKSYGDKRELGGLSRKKACRLSGLSEEAIKLIEEGKSVKPSGRTVLALIDVPDLALEYKDCPPHIQRLGTLGDSGDAFQRYQLRELHYSCARATYQDLLKSWETLPEPTLSDAREWIGKRLAEIDIGTKSDQRQLAMNESLGRQVESRRVAAG